MTEVGGIAEPPEEGDLGNGSPAHTRIRQVRTTPLQSSISNVLSDSAARHQEQAVQVPDRDPHRTGNFDWVQAGLRNVSVNVAVNLAAQFGGTRCGMRI